MVTRKIQQERIQNLNEADVREGDYFLYWMQSSQHAEQNHALEYAVQRANDLGQRLLVVFGLTDVRPIAYNHPASRDLQATVVVDDHLEPEHRVAPPSPRACAPGCAREHVCRLGASRPAINSVQHLQPEVLRIRFPVGTFPWRSNLA